MIINGKSVDAYYDSHSLQQINTVIQTLETFGLHRELELYLKRRKFKKKNKPEPVDRLERMLRRISNQCPKCGGSMSGASLSNCERKSSGRTWYEECNFCSYYREEFGGR